MSTDVTVTVTIHDRPRQQRAQAVAIVLTVVLVAYAMGWLWWLVAATALYVKARLVWWMYCRARVAEARERQRRNEIAARADQQHHWHLAGDPRGVHGDYPPAELVGV
jgi:hypothetical protein